MHKKYKRVVKYVKANYTRIPVKSGTCRLNYKCQLNAIHDAVTAGDKSIAMCVYIDADGEPVIHFLNKKGSVYTDNTLGYWSHENQYYLVREIKKVEFNNVSGLFTSLRDFLATLPPWYHKIFKKVIV